MGDEDSSEAEVVIVDDETDVADSYAAALSGKYAVETAYDGEAALEVVDDATDVALLDRRMPEMTGDEVLAEIQHRHLDCRTALVTGVSPDFDIIELGFDDYVVKPVDVDELRELVERLLALDEYEDAYQQYSSCEVKREVLKAEKTAAELASSDEYAELTARLEELAEHIDDIESEHDLEDYHAP